MSSKALNAVEGTQEHRARAPSLRPAPRLEALERALPGHRSTPRASERAEVTTIPVLIPQRARWHTSSPARTGSDVPRGSSNFNELQDLWKSRPVAGLGNGPNRSPCGIPASRLQSGRG